MDEMHEEESKIYLKKNTYCKPGCEIKIKILIFYFLNLNQDFVNQYYEIVGRYKCHVLYCI